jgi:hypothetical protein
MPKRAHFTFVLAAAFLLAGAAQAAEIWQLEPSGTVTFALEDAQLESMGLTLVNPRKTVVSDQGRAAYLAGPFYSFQSASSADVRFETLGGRFQNFVSEGPARIAFDGGMTVQTHHTAPRAALQPAFLYDFGVEFAPASDSPVFARITSTDPGVPAPLEIHSTGIRFDHETGVMAVRMGDVRISEDWALSMNQPYLAGQVIGTAEMDFTARLIEGFVREVAVEPVGGGGQGTILDVKLGELYGMSSYGHSGTFPNGENAFSAATTSCNVGNVRVPWHAPMDAEHPLIGLAMFREVDGILEMIGQSDIKHGFFALSSSDCNQCNDGTNGDSLGVNCSDTYSAGNNASQHYLAPRSEINPFTAVWNPCGSHFDGPNNDCNRSHGSSGHSSLQHRMHVYDSDLNVAGAAFTFEGLYVVADDQNFANNLGWKALNSVNWSGSSWTFSQSGVIPNPGPRIRTWGDMQHEVSPADDGAFWLATKTADNGDGTWHYEYALYNARSDRGAYSFEVPTGAASLTNDSFHDPDQTGANDWTVSTAAGVTTWSTDDFATDPGAPALFHQTMFNFRFDADVPPTDGSATSLLFKPGAGTSIVLNTKVPTSGATSALAGSDAYADFVLSSNDPNPFSSHTKLSFSLARDTNVTLSVIDVTGRTVQVLHDGTANSGVTNVDWDGRDTSGNRVASGVYFFRLDSNDRSTTIKGTLLR